MGYGVRLDKGWSILMSSLSLVPFGQKPVESSIDTGDRVGGPSIESVFRLGPYLLLGPREILSQKTGVPMFEPFFVRTYHHSRGCPDHKFGSNLLLHSDPVLSKITILDPT